MGVDLHRRGGKGAFEVADSFDAAALVRRFRIGSLRRQIEPAVATHIVDLDQCRRCARLLEALRNDDRDRLVIMLDVGPAKEVGEVHRAQRQRWHVKRREDVDHARRGARILEVDGVDAALGDG